MILENKSDNSLLMEMMPKCAEMSFFISLIVLFFVISYFWVVATVFFRQQVFLSVFFNIHTVKPSDSGHPDTALY